VRTLLAGAVFMATLAGAAPALPARHVPARAPAIASGAVRAHHCQAGETALYSCRFGANLGSVCAAAGRIAYRFGPPGNPRIAIESMPDWSNVHVGHITGGGGGFQDHARFSAAGHDYVVFEAVGGELTEVSGKRWSGIHVRRGGQELATLACGRQSRGNAIGLSHARDFTPSAVGAAVEESDSRFDAWF
jgi:hypothetical protein